ncbi:MAG TPA: S-layer homology domain-containing protein [Chthonomonadaceae bacterium]|nr:S-layer homology domain-containing protein [Chthonomonadaceae bacterium]
MYSFMAQLSIDKILVKVCLCLTLIGAVPAANAQPTEPFPDVPKDHWAYQAVMELKQKGILIGYPDGTFNGAGARGKQPTKPTYDLSSPEATWHFLLLAMRNRDEHSIHYVMTKEFIDSDKADWQRLFHPSVKTLKERLGYYQKREKEWSKWHLSVPHDTTVDEIDGSLYRDFSSMVYRHYFIGFKKTEEGWKIRIMFLNIE